MISSRWSARAKERRISTPARTAAGWFRATRPGRRAAYSLIELLIVLGVLALMAGLTLPALWGPLDRGRLRGAGRELQNALAKTRSLAIRSGQTHWLSYEFNGRNWRIETRPTPPVTEIDSVPADIMSLEPEPEALVPAASVIVREGELPDGVVFASPDELQTEPASLTAEAAPAPVISNTWSDPIRFQPNGRARSATIIVNGTRDFRTVISLRGLTGTISVRTSRKPASDEEPQTLTAETTP